MKRDFAVAVFVIMLFPMMAYAGYYQYKGADGTVHYTDNIANVPQDQLPNVKHYKDAEPSPPPDMETQPAAPADVTQNPASKTPSSNATASELKARAEELEQERADLNKTFEQLMADRKNLGPRPGRGAPLGEVQAYDKKADSLRQRMAEYTARRNAYQKKVDAFNAEIKAAK